MSVARRGVHIPADRARLEGGLSLPADALGIVAFAHGSGSSSLRRLVQLPPRPPTHRVPR
jgi:hypothetical protein